MTHNYRHLTFVICPPRQIVITSTHYLHTQNPPIHLMQPPQEIDLEGLGLPSVAPTPAHTAKEVVEPRHVHPDSQKMYQMCGGKLAWTRYIPIFGRAIECYGPWFMFTLDFTGFLSKGIAYYILQAAGQPMFMNRYKSSAMEFQRFNSVSWMGWSIKPLTAVVSDSVAVFGYTKRWYLTVSSILSGVCLLAYASLPPTHASAAAAAAFAFLAGYGQANLDILSEGLYSRLMRRYPDAGPVLISSLWWVLSMAGIISSFIQGPLSDGGLEHVGVYVAGACMFCAVPFFVLNWFGELTNREERLADYIHHQEAVDGELASSSSGAAGSVLCLPDEKPHVHEPDDDELNVYSYCGGAIQYNSEMLQKNFRMSVYAIVMSIAVVATAIVTINGNRWAILSVCASVSVLLCAMGFWALPLIVAKANVYKFLNKMLYVQIAGPVTTFFVATSDQYPDGPNFSYFFFNTTSSVIGFVAAVVGVSMFPYIFAKRSYQLTQIVTTCLIVLGSIFDVFIVERWNIAVGIPDHWAYICGDAIIYQIAYMLAWMPMTILIAQLCPRGSESTVYALLAGLANLGQTMAQQIGTLLMSFVWPVNTTDIPYDFSNLTWLIVVGHLIMPLFQIPLVFFLLPRVRICDEIPVDDDTKEVNSSSDDAHHGADSSSSTHGSHMDGSSRQVASKS